MGFLLRLLGLLRGGPVLAYIEITLAAIAASVLLVQHEQVNHLKLKLAEQSAEYAKAEVQADKEQRAKEYEWRANRDEVIAEAHATAASAVAAAASATDSAERLRQRLAAATASRPSQNPAPAAGSPPETVAARMCTDVLGSVLTAAGRYASIADEARLAGTACERSYDSLTK